MTPKYRCAECGQWTFVQVGSVYVCAYCEKPDSHAEVPDDDVELPKKGDI